MHEVYARVVSDRDEQPLQFERALCTGHSVAQGEPGDRLGALDADDLGVPHELDLVVRESAVLHDLRRAKGVLAVDHVDLVGEPGEEVRLLHRRVAATDDRDHALAEEEPVTRGTPRHTVPGETLFVFEPELAVGGARGEDHRERLVHGTGPEGHRLHVTGEIDTHDVVENDLGTEPLGLRLHLHHQVGALDPVGEPGEVLHLGGVHQLTAGLDGGGDQQRLEVGARRIDGCRISGGAGTDDDDLPHSRTPCTINDGPIRLADPYNTS